MCLLIPSKQSNQVGMKWKQPELISVYVGFSVGTGTHMTFNGVYGMHKDQPWFQRQLYLRNVFHRYGVRIWFYTNNRAVSKALLGRLLLAFTSASKIQYNALKASESPRDAFESSGYHRRRVLRKSQSALGTGPACIAHIIGRLGFENPRVA